jgi:hypothetical protein
MTILRWRCAHGDPPAVELSCGEIVPLAPEDDSVDSNIVRITGGGTIRSFGEGHCVTKRVVFSEGTRLVHNPPRLALLTGQDRMINVPSIGTYSCDRGGDWTEVHFTATGGEEASRRMDAIERRLHEIEKRLDDAFADSF